VSWTVAATQRLPVIAELDFVDNYSNLDRGYIKLLLNDGVRENTLRKESICEVRILTVKAYSMSGL